MVKDDSRQQHLDILDIVPPRRRQKTRQLQRRLNEVIHGRRAAVKVYSNILQSEIWFVNEGLVDPSDRAFGGNVVTMTQLANMMSHGEPLPHVIRQIISNRTSGPRA